MSSPILVTLSEEAVDAIVEIEQTVDHPTWNKRLLGGEFHNSFSKVYGARLNGKLISYLIVHTVLDEVHIVNLAVHADSRRQGVARFMLRAVFEDLYWEGARKAYLEVRVSNTAAQNLYESFTFKQVGVRKQYYSNNKEDALVLQIELQDFFDRFCAQEDRVANE
jgi:ribosomal-protein-alanine N-acetyltransferase